MKVGTYNIWYAVVDWRERTKALCEEIRRIDCDVLALQEVHETYDPSPGGRMIDYLASETGYQHRIWGFSPKRDKTSGSAYLSKLPIESVSASWDTKGGLDIADGLLVVTRDGDSTFCVTNTHFGYPDVAAAEQQIVELDSWIRESAPGGAYKLLLGDLNVFPGSSVHSFLCGNASLQGKSAKWADIGAEWAKRHGQVPADTVDPVRNPRWSLYERDYVDGPFRSDYILVHDDWHVRNTLKITDFSRFGDIPNPRNGRVPSDHYGVYVELEIVPEAIGFQEMVDAQYSR